MTTTTTDKGILFILLVLRDPPPTLESPTARHPSVIQTYTLSNPINVNLLI